MALLLRIVAALGVAAFIAAAQPVHAATPNDTARFLAGMMPSQGSPLEPLTQDPAWQHHAELLDKVWKGLEEQQLSKVRAWSRAHVATRRPVTYYFFSGPDFLYADAFLPGASTYILAGLEPIGPQPDVLGLRRTLGYDLEALRTSISTLLSRSYFITSYMGADLSASQLRGTLPILYVFLARTGKTIHEVSFVTVKQDGGVEPSGEGRDGARGVKIVFSGPDRKQQTLYYFRTDLANKGVQASGFLEFCRKFGIGDVFIKAASYLLHTPQFSIVRDFLLAYGATVVQDDTGVPLRFFEQRAWKVQPFGRYVGPIPVFRGNFQHKLKVLFEKSGAPPIDFGIGYRWKLNESHVILAHSPDPQSPPPTAEAAPVEKRAPAAQAKDKPAPEKVAQEKSGPEKSAANRLATPQPSGDSPRPDKGAAPERGSPPEKKVAPEQRAAAADKKAAPDKLQTPGRHRGEPDAKAVKGSHQPPSPPQVASERQGFVSWPSVLFGGLFSAALVGLVGLEGIAAGVGFILQVVAIGLVARLALGFFGKRGERMAASDAATAQGTPTERWAPAEGPVTQTAGAASKAWPIGLADRLRRLAAR
jgi:hypothetical protein